MLHCRRSTWFLALAATVVAGCTSPSPFPGPNATAGAETTASLDAKAEAFVEVSVAEAESSTDPDAALDADAAAGGDLAVLLADGLTADLAPDADAATEPGDVASADESADTALEPLDSTDAGGLADAGLAVDAGPADASALADATAASDGAVAGDAGAATDIQVPADAATGANLHLHVTNTLGTASGVLMIKLADPAVMMEKDQGGPPNLVVYQGPLPTTSFDLFVVAPPGKWKVVAVAFGGGAMPLGGALLCDGLKPAVVEFGPASPPLQSYNLSLASMQGAGPANLCVFATKPPAKAFLSEIEMVSPPPTVNGGAHFLSGLVWNDRLWVAGFQDGLVSFDFPPATAGAPKPMYNWKVYGNPACTRHTRVGTRIFCSSRSSYLHVLTVDPVTQNQLSVFKKALSAPVGTEGLGHRAGVVYVAAHAAGLLALDATPPHGELPLQSPSLTDAWDVAPLGPSHLVVANGLHGLSFLDVGSSGLNLSIVSGVDLPGRAAFLHVTNEFVLVGALGGGLHVVDATNPTAPKLLGSLLLPGNVNGVTLHQGLVFAAAGHYVVAVDLPKPGVVQPLLVRGAVSSKHFALDVDPFGSNLVTSEFQAVRQLKLDLTVPPGPVLVAPAAVYSPVVQAGQPLKTTLHLRNIGSAPLVVTQVGIDDGQPKQWQTGPWTIQPEQSLSIAVAGVKKQKGVLKHQLVILSNDTTSPELGLDFNEVDHLQPGEPLPAMTYHDASGKAWNLKTHFQGKAGLLMVAAQTCPVAFLGIASAQVDMLPLMATGKVAVAVVNPWDKPSAPEAALLKPLFPILYSPLTTNDGHDWSDVLDVYLTQEISWGPPMPIVYVPGIDGKITFARWGYETKAVVEAIKAAAGL